MSITIFLSQNSLSEARENFFKIYVGVDKLQVQKVFKNFARKAQNQFEVKINTTKKRHIRDILGRTNFFSVIHMTLL